MPANYQPTFLNRWKHPDNYFGAQWLDYFGSGCGQHRDSDALERANFRAMLNALGFDSNETVSDNCPTDTTDEPTRIIVRENHWAVEWVEWIAIHESDEAGLRIADTIIKAKQDYPVIDESLWSEYEDTECNEVWANCFKPKERSDYLKTHSVTICPENKLSVKAAIQGNWSEAANLLPCPSDILN